MIYNYETIENTMRKHMMGLDDIYTNNSLFLQVKGSQEFSTLSMPTLALKTLIDKQKDETKTCKEELVSKHEGSLSRDLKELKNLEKSKTPGATIEMLKDAIDKKGIDYTKDLQTRLDKVKEFNAKVSNF